MDTLLAIVPYIGQVNRPLILLLILIGLWLCLQRTALPMVGADRYERPVRTASAVAVS
jgi:hypothetical protein